MTMMNGIIASSLAVPSVVDDDVDLHGATEKEEDNTAYDVPSELKNSVAESNDEPVNRKAITPVEVVVLRELREEQIIQVIDEMKSGRHLDDVLQEMAKPILQRVQKTFDEQYVTLDAVKATATPGDIGDESLDDTINIRVAPVISDKVQIDDIVRMARVTPLRLNYDERSFLRLLESTLEVSEYTDRVDVLSRSSPARRMANEIKQICAILTGLTVAYKYEAGQKLIREREFKENAEFFRSVFEIGRRYKILNPERMRDSYGKLVYFLMDSQKSHVMDDLEFDCVSEVKTVYSILSKKKNGNRLLRDPLLRLATAEIMPEGKARSRVQWEISQKEAAIKTLAKKYATVQSACPGSLLTRFTNSIFLRNASAGESSETDDTSLEDISPDEIEQCLYSFCDHYTFLRFNREPCDKMIASLHKYFNPKSFEPNLCLAITMGRSGSRLTHSHERQFFYVLQSLTLWRNVLHEMLGLWSLAEIDMLDKNNPYHLRDTGQGLNRVQDAPHVYRSMSRILHSVQEKVGGWCGSSTIHLGDHNVPNALIFIDKYIQVPRILGPLVLCLEKIPYLAESTPAMQQYIADSFGGPAALIKTILCDFFRHAFDGSGADNFYDAGSCIDGRLTSAWNWCSKIEKKSYFPVFLLTGFAGFDGRF